MHDHNQIIRDEILIFNASPDKFQTLADILYTGQYRLLLASTLHEAINLLNKANISLVIINAENSPSLKEIISELKFNNPWIEIIVMSENNLDPELYKLLLTGTFDCMIGTFEHDELVVKVQKAIEHSFMKQELMKLRQQVAMNYGYDNIIGISKPILKLKETIQRIAPTDISVMLTGAPGTGKELIARVIHYHSERRKYKFTQIDCSTIPEELFESTLFGDTKHKTYSGQSVNKGLLYESNGGTVFFNEIEKLPPSIQPRIQKFIQDNTVIHPETSENIKLDVRFISASSKEINRIIEEGDLSEELFYLLTVLPIKVPSLAERKEDIELLVDYFLRNIAHEMNRSSLTINRFALDLLIAHSWQGNVRELENTLKRAAALCRDNQLDADDIIFIVNKEDNRAEQNQLKTIMKSKEGLLKESQRTIISKALDDNDWNFTQTAQDLGIGRTTLWRKVKKYNLKKEAVLE